MEDVIARRDHVIRDHWVDWTHANNALKYVCRLVVVRVQIIRNSVHDCSALLIADNVRVIFFVQQTVNRSEIVVLFW
jgi:hypothetical protein